MEYEEYLSDISFRFLNPLSKLPPGYQKIAKILQFCNISIESYITRLPDREKEMKKKLHSLLKVPRMSTFAIGAMINYCVANLPDNEAFVNVGVWNGYTLLAGMKDNPDKICIGIDNFSEFGGPRKEFRERFNKFRSPNHLFFDMDYEQYFSEIHKGTIGFYIYDGEHSYKNQLKGLQIAEPFLSEHSYILVDDTNWEAPRQATLDFIEKSDYDYKVIFNQGTLFNGHPTFWNGIMVLKRI